MLHPSRYESASGRVHSARRGESLDKDRAGVAPKPKTIPLARARLSPYGTRQQPTAVSGQRSLNAPTPLPPLRR